jgi:4a-hydroxytetrahydrobiopterin dehydratase
MADVLADDEIEQHAPTGWNHAGEEIVRTYEFDEYLDGVAFANDVAEIADEEVHHPEIQIRYDEVEVHLTSHEAGGVTEQDLDMAERFNDLR